ncbi:unnamed protein product [Hapterophycus canaliculatus]
MVLSRVLSELVHFVSPWRHAPVGSLIISQGGWELAGVGSSRADVYDHEDMCGPFWFAVPKKRVPVGKKRTRTADRTPKRITHYSLCSKCGQPKLNHKFCNNIELCAADSSARSER